MANNESTNITGNIAGEKLTRQKKEVSIVEDTDGTYVERTTQLFINISNGFSTGGNRLAAHAQIYAHADANTVGQACINLRRGLADSYIELVMR